MLDALVDGQDREVARSLETSGVEHVLQGSEHANRPVGRPVHSSNPVRIGQMEPILGNGSALVVQERARVLAKSLFDCLKVGHR